MIKVGSFSMFNYTTLIQKDASTSNIYVYTTYIEMTEFSLKNFWQKGRLLNAGGYKH